MRLDERVSVMNKKILPVMFLGLVLFSLTGCGNKNENVNLAMSSIEELKYDEASQYLDQAVAASENERLINRARGLVAMGSADYEEAVNYFTAALQGSNGKVLDFDFDTSYYLAAAEYKLGDYKAAEKTYSAIIGLRPKDSIAYFLRGTSYISEDLKDEALRDFNSAIDMDSKNPDLYMRIFESLDNAGYTEEGQDYLDRAKALDVKLSDLQKGRLFYCSGDYEEARNFLEKARMAGDDSAVLYLGRTYEELGDLNYAASLYKTYLEKYPGDTLICNQLGLCELSFGDYPEALKAFEEGLMADDGSIRQTLRFNEIVAYEYMSDFKKAAVLMQGYLADYPDDENAKREYNFLKTR